MAAERTGWRRLNPIVAPVSGDTIAVTTTKTAFARQLSVPANLCVAGTSLRLTAHLVTSTGISILGGVAFRIEWGSVILLATATQTLTANLSSALTTLEATIDVVTGGASSQLECQGWATSNATGVGSLQPLSNAALVSGPDLTAAQTLKITVQGGAGIATGTSVQLRALQIDGTVN